MKKSGVMVIGGSDSIAGAGIQADIKTLQTIGVFATTVITAVTAQNTSSIIGIQQISTDIVKKQILQIDDEIDVQIVKTGMLYSEKIVDIVEKYIKNDQKLILDPVMVATSGRKLMTNSSVFNKLISKAYIITPNIPEAEVLSGIKIKNANDIKSAAEKIIQLGAKNVLIKGSHINESEDFIINRLFCDTKIFEFKNKRFKGDFHGTGCMLSSALSGYLYKKNDLYNATELALNFVTDFLDFKGS